VVFCAGGDRVDGFHSISAASSSHASHSTTKLLVAIFGLMWRYLFVFIDEAIRLARARSARSGYPAGHSHAGGTLSWRAKVTGGMLAICS